MRSALFHREITGDNVQLKKMIAKKVEENVKNDIFSATRIDCQTDISRVGYNNFYTAILSSQTNLLTLYDNLTFEQIWQIKVTDLEDYRCDCSGLIVSDSGTVLYMAKDTDALICSKPPHVQIFLDGQLTGAFFIDAKSFAASTLTIINNRIFGVSQSWEDRQFYEWNIEGELVQVISMNMLKGAGGSKIAVCDEYFIVSAEDSGLRTREPTLPIFILNLISNNVHVFDLCKYGFSLEDHRVSAVRILNNELFIAYHTHKLTDRYSFKVPVDVGILVLDIKTGETLKNYLYEDARCVIHHLKVNNDFIAFLNYQGLNTGDTIYAINRHTHELTKAQTISRCCYSEMRLHLTGSLLTVTSPRGYWNTGWSVTDRYVVDLNECRTLQRVEYKSYPFHQSFFGSGTYISITSCSDVKSIYIERFNHLSNKTTYVPNETLRTFKELTL